MKKENILYLNLNSFQICCILACDYQEVTKYLSTTVAPFTIKFQHRNLEKDQLADAPIPLPSNLVDNLINDIVEFALESSPDEVRTENDTFVFVFILGLLPLLELFVFNCAVISAHLNNIIHERV